MNIEKCDVCGLKTNALVDYYAMLCHKCSVEHTDMVLIKRIGYLMEKIEATEHTIKRRLDEK